MSDTIVAEKTVSQCEPVQRITLKVTGEEAFLDNVEKQRSSNPAEENVYDRFSRRRKYVIVILVSFYSFLSPFSSISILSATPEVSSWYGATGTTINISNALYMVSMGISAPFWAPLSQVYGRRMISLISGALFFCFSLSNIFAPTLAAYFIFRILVAFQGTSFLVIGAAVIGDIYAPQQRGTALSWFLFGGLIGPALGPLIGGIIVTYQSWQVIFGLQAGMAGLALVLAVCFLPETIHYRRDVELKGLSKCQVAFKIWQWTNPFRVLHLFSQPGIVLVALASSSLQWNMYALLSPIRYVLNPRFNLTTPMQSALFYLAPGAGYLVGAMMGGRWSDYTLKRLMRKRDGVIVPEDRLRSSLVALAVFIPGSILIYGWSVEKEVGGMPLPVAAMFVQGVAQLFALPSLNTYCLDVMPGRSAEVIALNYMMRYCFSAGGTAVALPAIDSMGVGWFSTISSLFLVATAVMVAITYRYGHLWRSKIALRSDK